MVGMDATLSEEDMARELLARATQLWGQARAETIRRNLEAQAQEMWVIARNLPHREVDPGFFL